jgi:hypothetical protein
MKTLVIAISLICVLAGFSSHGEFAIIADQNGNLQSIALDGSFTIRELGQFPKVGTFFTGLSLRPGKNHLYGSRWASDRWPNGSQRNPMRVHYVDLPTGLLRFVEDSPMIAGRESTVFSLDGRYLYVVGDHKDMKGDGGPMVVDMKNGALIHEFEKPLYRPVFSADSSTLFYFGIEGIRAFRIAERGDSLYCAGPGRRGENLGLDLLVDSSRMLLISAQSTLELPVFGHTVSVVKDGGYRPIFSLNTVSGRPIANNASSGPFWFYDVAPGARTRVVVSTPEYAEVERDPAYPPGPPVVFRVDANDGTVSSFQASGSDFLPFNEESELGLTEEDAKWAFEYQSIFASPSGNYLLFLYHRGYREVGKVLVYDTRIEKYVKALKLGKVGLTNLVFVHDEPQRIRFE